MPRKVEISLPPDQTGAIIDKIEGLEGLIGMRLQRNSSLKPKGDVISLEKTNKSISVLMRMLHENNLLSNADVSVTTSEPQSVIARSSSWQVLIDQSETIPEEMQANMNSQSNMSLNSMAIMFLAGVLATIGISTNSLHIVIGAMVIAPGFEPITRFVFGLATRHRDWTRGLVDTGKGFLSLVVGAIFASVALRLLGEDIIGGEASYLPSGVLVTYWTTITSTSILITIAAAAAGAYVLITNRPVLTAGVMIALALVPAASITGMGIVAGDLAVAEKAFYRLLLEILIITGVTGLIFFVKRNAVHKRDMQV